MYYYHCPTTDVSTSIKVSNGAFTPSCTIVLGFSLRIRYFKWKSSLFAAKWGTLEGQLPPASSQLLP